MAVVPIPSLTSHEAFDSAVVLGAAAAARLLDHGRQAYAAARRIETAEEIRDLRSYGNGEHRHERGKEAVIDTRCRRLARICAVVQLTQALVRVPSRSGIDSYDPVLDHMAAWLADHGLTCHRLAGPDGADSRADMRGARRRGRVPRYVLDACLDTAPFGEEAAWTYPPASGEITDEWLHGRGSSDSKAGAAIFAHVAARLRDMAGASGGSVVLLFDVDEHTGGFGGAKAYFEGAGCSGPGRRGHDWLPGPGSRDHWRTRRAARPAACARRRRAFRVQPGRGGRDRQGCGTWSGSCGTPRCLARPVRGSRCQPNSPSPRSVAVRDIRWSRTCAASTSISG